MNPQEPKTDYLVVMEWKSAKPAHRRSLTDSQNEIMRFSSEAEAQTCASIENTTMESEFIRFVVFERDLRPENLRTCPKCERIAHPVTDHKVTLCELCGWKWRARQKKTLSYFEKRDYITDDAFFNEYNDEVQQ